jgi:hypothetical protein
VWRCYFEENPQPAAGLVEIGRLGGRNGRKRFCLMSVVPTRTEVWAAFRTKDPAPELPELRGRAIIDHDVGRYHADAQSEIRVRLHEVEPKEVIRALQNGGARISRYFLTPCFLPGFWEDPPADLAGALLVPDGHVALRDSALYWRVVPSTEPLYTLGRPEADSEHSRYKPHLLHAGGIPIVSDELFAALRPLGAEGETGKVIYRGFKKAAHDTVQQGYRRFLPRPEYEMPYCGGFEFFPEAAPIDFGVCAMLRFRKGLPDRVPGISRNLAEDRWYEIAVALSACQELRESRRRIPLTPIFRLGGATHRWVSELEVAVEELRA